MSPSYVQELSQVDWFERGKSIAINLSKPFIELGRGLRGGTIPWLRCLGCCLILELLLLGRLDRWLIAKTRFIFLYPKGFWTYQIYYFFCITFPFLTWGINESIKRNRLTKAIETALEAIGLKNNLGKIPHYIFDKPIDKWMRKLRMSRSAIPVSTFQQNKEALEGVLQIFIDEIRENRTDGTVDVIYSATEMPKICKVLDYKKVSAPSFIVGTTRSKEIRSNLIENPHLLIAGLSGGGKSTFTRQLIVTLYLNDQTARFTIIDLKGAVESQFFENLKRVDVPQTMEDAVYALESLRMTIEYRLKLLKANGCKDIGEFFNIPIENRKPVTFENGRVLGEMTRHIVVVDEAAEMFLASHGKEVEDVQKAKESLSLIARQGRAIGIHLVLATQRPDARALDTQIKANLSGVLCFQMANDASSILVLGNGRATDLPAIPGRAIWKMGREMVEVQTPLLTKEETKQLLKPYAIASQETKQNLDLFNSDLKNLNTRRKFGGDGEPTK